MSAPRACSVWLVLLALLVVGCAQSGVYHVVRPGDNLYRIGKRYSVSSRAIARANNIRDVRSLSVGTRLWIAADARRPVEQTRRSSKSVGSARERARSQARSEAQLAFAWPVRGKLTSRYGRRRGGPHEGIDIGARRGTPVRAAEAGKVIHAGRMGDYGRLVVVKHAGTYRSVYAHLGRISVRRGAFVERGDVLGQVGSTGNATGPHLHFEIRRRETTRNPML